MLGGLLEDHLRWGPVLNRGISNPLTLSLLTFTLLVLLSAILPTVARRSEVLLGEE